MKSEMISTFVKMSGKAAVTVFLGFTIAGCTTPANKEVLGLHQTGTMAFMLNCDKAASTYFEKAIETDPEYGPSYIMLGDCYLREGKSQKAIKALEKGLQYTTDEGHLRLAHRKLARAYHQTGQNEKALANIIQYTKLSILQGKFDQERKTETEEFIASLDLQDSQKVDLASIINKATLERKAMLAEAQKNNLTAIHSRKESKDVTGVLANLLGL